MFQPEDVLRVCITVSNKKEIESCTESLVEIFMCQERLRKKKSYIPALTWLGIPVQRGRRVVGWCSEHTKQTANSFSACSTPATQGQRRVWPSFKSISFNQYSKSLWRTRVVFHIIFSLNFRRATEKIYIFIQLVKKKVLVNW